MFDLPFMSRYSLYFGAARDLQTIPESCDDLRSTRSYGGASADGRFKIGRPLLAP